MCSIVPEVKRAYSDIYIYLYEKAKSWLIHNTWPRRNACASAILLSNCHTIEAGSLKSTYSNFVVVIASNNMHQVP
jgi:hypothetical protein